jgi:two-component system, NtrC family, nitrogen regulation response regulator NtrX
VNFNQTVIWHGPLTGPGNVSQLAVGTRLNAVFAESIQNVSAAIARDGVRCVCTVTRDEASGQALLALVNASPRPVPVVFYCPGISVSGYQALMKAGAGFCIGEPVSAERLAEIINSVSSESVNDATLAGNSGSSLLIGDSSAMKQVRTLIHTIAKRNSTVLVTGETGTGKDLAARSLHLESERAARPLVSVNCAALPESLLEAELFGHVKGAFTGALTNRTGRFEEAHRSSLFLDEIGEMPLETQAKLLRVVQERELQRLGSSETVKVDVRVIAASNVNLSQAAKLRRFRPDLLYRLRVVELQMPALRDPCAGGSFSGENL